MCTDAIKQHAFFHVGNIGYRLVAKLEALLHANREDGIFSNISSPTTGHLNYEQDAHF